MEQVLQQLTLKQLKEQCRVRKLTMSGNKKVLIDKLVKNKISLSDLPDEWIHSVAVSMDIPSWPLYLNATDRHDAIVAIENKMNCSTNVTKRTPLKIVKHERLEDARQAYNSYLQTNMLVDEELLDEEWKGFDPYHRED